MKKLFSLMVMAVAILFSSAFVSCEDNDGYERLDDLSAFVGTWSVSDKDNSSPSTGPYDFEYIQFKSDGTYVNIIGSPNQPKGYAVATGDWIASKDNKIILHVIEGSKKGSTYMYDVMQVLPTKLVFSYFGAKSYYTKVADSVLDKYL